MNEIDAKIMRWNEVNEQISKLRAEELELRNVLVKHFFNKKAEDLPEGSEQYHLGNGFYLKANFSVSRKISSDEKVIERMINRLKQVSPIANDIVKTTIAFKPSLKLAEYKALPEEIKNVFSAVIIETPSQPSLSFAEPDKNE